MVDIKPIIAQNIVKLRSDSGMTQIELAEKLNYSDKAVSKWERAESLPDITVLKRIADLFGVTLDYLVTEEHEVKQTPVKQDKKRITQNHAFITGISILLVWLIATTVFVIMQSILSNTADPTDFYPLHWLAFVYAIPVTMIVWLVFNSIWFDRHRNFLIISLLMWTVIAAVYFTLLPLGINVWLIFLLGLPGQVIIVMWSKLRYRKEK